MNNTYKYTGADWHHHPSYGLQNLSVCASPQHYKHKLLHYSISLHDQSAQLVTSETAWQPRRQRQRVVGNAVAVRARQTTVPHLDSGRTLAHYNNQRTHTHAYLNVYRLRPQSGAAPWWVAGSSSWSDNSSTPGLR